MRFLNILRSLLRRGKGIGHRQQVVRKRAIDASPAEMIGEERRIGALHEPFELLHVLAIEPTGRAEVHGYAVLDDFVLFADGVEHFERATAIDHVVFGDHLEPVDDGLFAQDMAIVLDAQADPDAHVTKAVEAIGWHVGDNLNDWRVIPQANFPR